MLKYFYEKPCSTCFFYKTHIQADFRQPIDPSIDTILTYIFFLFFFQLTQVHLRKNYRSQCVYHGIRLSKYLSNYKHRWTSLKLREMMAGQQQIHHQSSKIKKSQLATASPHFKKQQLNSHSRGGFDVTDMRVISHRDEIKYNYSNLRRDNNVDDELTDGRETCNRYYIWGNISPTVRKRALDHSRAAQLLPRVLPVKISVD